MDIGNTYKSPCFTSRRSTLFRYVGVIIAKTKGRQTNQRKDAGLPDVDRPGKRQNACDDGMRNRIIPSGISGT